MNIIFWFRNDLRLSDNPGLQEASKKGQIMPIYIFDNDDPLTYTKGAAKWWLENSLIKLNKQLNHDMHFYTGKASEIIIDICKTNNIHALYWNRCYDLYRIKEDEKIKQLCKESNIECKSFSANLLFEPFDLLKNDGTNYQVYTPFYKKILSSLNKIRSLSPTPKIDTISNENKILFDKTIDKWSIKLPQYWDTGENAAKKRFNEFIKNGIEIYDECRDFPNKNSVSKLSPHIRFGEISPHEIFYTIVERLNNKNYQKFFSELCWRDFSYNLLYYNPQIVDKNLQSKFDHFPWQYNEEMLNLWKQGKTGFPLIDAGMRELSETGYIHNRVRMVVASFLTKNLLIDWRFGRDWFWECLTDADIANNSASWQWVAGSGADAAPYFRIFNPLSQAQKFDNAAEYIKKFVEELRNVPSDVILNITKNNYHGYIKPIIDLSKSRELALNAYISIKNN